MLQNIHLPKREFLKWLCRISGGYFAMSLAPPLQRVNTTLFSEANAACVNNPQLCGAQDCCSTQDNCGATDTTGHTCTQKDICDVDASKDCTNDECVEDSSDVCTNDKCTSDKSGSCENDTCESDKSGSCETDSCTSDSSGACKYDSCKSDSSGACETDQCVADSSKSCVNDTCVSDSSGSCVNDTCEADSSGGCENDTCVSDKSGACKNDSCVSDKSGSCNTDECVSDSSGDCVNDQCRSDSSGTCKNDTCTSDSSNTCINDFCIIDASGACEDDRCNSDYSGACKRDVCVLDLSTSCEGDLCREDRSPDIPGLDIDCTTDTCSFDLVLNHSLSRRHLAKAGVNQAIKWLYKISTIALFIALACGAPRAATVIDATNSVFFPPAAYLTSQPVSVPLPVGPFLRDCDNDGILEADTNGDGQCAGDPKVQDYNGDGTRELPPGTLFAGAFQFTCFHIPSDVAIIATGPLTIKGSQEVAIFGTMKLSSGVEISSPVMIDLHTSAWLSDTANITFITALAGEVDETQTSFDSGGTVPPIAYNSICAQQQPEPAVAVPTLTELGLILLIAILGTVSVYFLSRRWAMAKRNPA
jgi:hypothetical protein